MSTPETGYTAMQTAINVLDTNPKAADLVAILREITNLLAQDDVLRTANDMFDDRDAALAAHAHAVALIETHDLPTTD